jgi:hypothetical protein
MWRNSSKTIREVRSTPAAPDGMVGDTWLAFIGSEFRPGTSGLGPTPVDALEDFNLHFMGPLISRNDSEAG